jgi:protocatechuate 3,4-dioxygenase beta subunit
MKRKLVLISLAALILSGCTRTQPVTTQNQNTFTPIVTPQAVPEGTEVTPVTPVATSTTSTTSGCGALTPATTEGPYYRAGAPERTEIFTPTTPGEPIMLSGYVYDTDCKPIAGARLDFWQADGQGNYDNQEFNLRGQQKTDATGRYVLYTVIPGEYPGRTPHIHVKVGATESSEILTTQLFIPGVASNSGDTIFDETLLVTMQDSEAIQSATFDFVVAR